MDRFLDTPAIAWIRKNLIASAAIIATLVVVAAISVIAISKGTTPSSIPKSKFQWSATEYYDTVQKFLPPEEGSDIGISDAGFVSGDTSFWLGQRVPLEMFTVIDKKENRYRVQTLSGGLELELFENEEGLYIQTMRCVNKLIPTTRGATVGMIISDALSEYPKSATTYREGSSTVIVAADTLITLKLDSQERIVEISMRFTE